MRLGVLSYDYAPAIGGMGIVAKRYVDRMRQQFPEHTIIVIAPGTAADDRVSAIARLRYLKSGGCPIFSLILSMALPQIIRKHRLDVLHVHAGSGGVFLLRKPQCPLVVTAHHTYRQEAEFVFNDRPVKKFMKSIMGILERRTYRLADRIIAVSADTAAALIEDYGIPQSRIRVIENPVNLPPEGELFHPKDFTSILYVGRLEERKGCMTLLRAMVLLRNHFPSIRLTVIGSNLLGSSVQRFIVDNQLEAHIQLLGFVDQGRYDAERRRAGIVVVPSLMEGFGLVAAEAMADGACVVGADAPGLRSLIRDKETGLLFKSGDAACCVAAMEWALGNTAATTTIGRHAAEDVRRRCDVSKRTRDLERIISSTKF
ncbi:MAG: glycosyltransferase family 4 protein [Candidatus Peribacteraceae bacterium]|nr:glycosyltransferase family 4 protein [Candidatus Peribacteraceae bacterium]